MLNEIVQAVQSIGIPAVTLIACMWYINQTDIRQRAERKELTESHHAESSEMRETIANNTIAIQRLCDILDNERRKEINE